MFKKHRYRPFKYKKKSFFFLGKLLPSDQKINFFVNYFLYNKAKANFFFLPSVVSSTKNPTFILTNLKDLVCNIAIKALFFSKSTNTYAKKTAKGFRLPSGNTLKTDSVSNFEIFEKKQINLYKKKASSFFFKKIKQTVRGVAKNAVDHPHGGKGRGGVLRGF